MGFILRSVFWLSLASILVPADLRLGHDPDAVAGRTASLQDQVHDALYAAWGFAAEVGRTCETNPQLCAAGENLLSTVADTVAESGAALVREAQSHLAPAESDRPMTTAAAQHKKIQSRVE